MSKHIFDPEVQLDDLAGKIVVGLERISEAFKMLLWEKAKEAGLSPIQIQILIFVAYHDDSLCNVSHLAKEFNVTKPTISDAVRVLAIKGQIKKEFSKSDSRSYSIRLSSEGKKMVKKTADFVHPLTKEIAALDKGSQLNMFQNLTKLIYQLNQNGILTVQRTCHACHFFGHKDGKDYCNFLRKPLGQAEIRLDCPEFESKAV